MPIRGGGHMTWAGDSNIGEGVTIDISLVNQVEYSSETKVASIGAGALWRDVYSALEPFGTTAPGGRTSTVGVAGFLTGGGNNFLSADVGLGCDNVVNFEVVLASGETVNANRETHSDLHKALKGGSSNFGIVTFYPLNTTEQHIAAYVKWVGNIPNYTKGSAVTFCAYTPTAGTVVSAALHDTSDSEWAPAYKDFQTIGPQIANTLRHDKRGGNVIGTEREAEDAILFQMQHMVRSASAEKEARKQLVAMRQEMKDFYISEGVNVEWEYLGYADGLQDPLSTYGQENIQFLKEVATKYDPHQVFQKRVPGRFKISKVDLI
ncbi:6-hydroxy-D-nicotine oxidase [Colletotrichum salicis]|uniref:6-hydroxy-D-nicotine oxidase n=1 Tax=Colletotrichum salicis TaxID=1209931 RepID=A0A135SVF5_9PEZI|nr:6-hydroxy-D-nicotine oxidase [Colletotrichum salicis]